MSLTLEEFSAMTAVTDSVNEASLGHGDLELRSQLESTLAGLINKQSSKPL